VKAINLIPSDARRGGTGGSRAAKAPTYVVLGLLAAALALVTVYVLTSNTISDRKAKLVTLRGEIAQAQAQAARLVRYAQFEKLSQARAATVRQIAASRFDWHAALSELSKVVPGNTSLQSLVATVSPGGSGAGGSSAGASNIRGAISSPAFELNGCTATQDDVARLMSRLRLINGVTRVTLGASQKSDSGQTGATVSSATPSPVGSSGAQGCAANAPTFDAVVFFKAPPGAALMGTGSQAPTAPAGAATTSTTQSSSSSTATTTTPGATK
jgi:Tfp pilus assembly protein PilN